MNNYNKLMNNLEILGLQQIKESYNKYLEFVNQGNKTMTEALYELSEMEMSLRNERAMHACIKVANFPFLKGLEDFNFSFQPTINKEEITNFKYLEFIKNKENIVLLIHEYNVTLGILYSVVSFVTEYPSLKYLLTISCF